MKQVSDKKARQNRLEGKLKKEMIEQQQGCCVECRKYNPSYLSKHEIVRRSAGGDPLDPRNCVGICVFPCHDRENNKPPEERRKSREEFPFFKGISDL